MSLRMLRPTLAYQRAGLGLIEQRAAEQVVARVTGSSLKAIRKRLFARSGGLCECPECQAGYPLKLTLQTMEADHIVPLELGGTNAFSNFRALHRDHHARLTAQQAAERAIRRSHP